MASSPPLAPPSPPPAARLSPDSRTVCSEENTILQGTQKDSKKDDALVVTTSVASASNLSLPYKEVNNMNMPAITAEQVALARLHRNSYSRRSHITPLFFLCAGVGKLILGFGASLAMQGGLEKQQSNLIVGCVLAGIGLCACVYAALGFGAAIARVNKKRAYIMKAISISGALTIGTGYIISTYFTVTYINDQPQDPNLTPERCSFLVLCLGTSLMCISLPNFTAYTELYRGRSTIVPIEKRSVVALGCMSPSLGLLFAGWITGEHSKWPSAFNAAVLTFAIALAIGGASLSWSDALRRRAMEAHDILCILEENNAVPEAFRHIGITTDSKSIQLDAEKAEATTS